LRAPDAAKVFEVSNAILVKDYSLDGQMSVGVFGDYGFVFREDGERDGE
jgi:hypothetical protein